MSEMHHEEAWQLYRQVLKERDAARAELDTLRLMTLDLVRERDEARAVGRDCYQALRRTLQTQERLNQEWWEELDRLRERVRPLGWLHEPPALKGERAPEGRCPSCGLHLKGSQPCPLCGPVSDREK
jgi:hypothetical protein